MTPIGKLKNGGPTMPVLSKKASNIITTVNNSSASIVISSPSFDGAATVSVSYPRQTLTEIVYALDSDAGVNVKLGQPLHMASDGKLYLADSTTNTNVVGFAMADANLGDKLEYGALGSLEVPDWTLLTGVREVYYKSAKKYFLQADGTIKTVIPTSGWLIHVGDGGTATSLNIEIDQLQSNFRKVMAATPIVLIIDKVRTSNGSTVIFDNIIPPTTSTGEVLIYNGSTFISDASFAQTSFVNNQISNLVGGASASYDTLGKIEAQMTSGTGSLVSVTSALITKAPLPAIPTPNGEVLTWDGGTFQNDNSFAQITYVDAEVLSLIDSATTYDTIGKLEGAVQQNEADLAVAQTDITTLQADMLTSTTPGCSNASGRGAYLCWRSFPERCYLCYPKFCLH